VKVRIGIANATKELEVSVEDSGELVTAYEAALANEEPMLTIEELDGSRTIVAVRSILYFGLEPAKRPGIGFAAEA
jgi:hypothetical protein